MTSEGRITSGPEEGGRKSYDLPLFTFGAVCHGSHELFFLLLFFPQTAALSCSVPRTGMAVSLSDRGWHNAKWAEVGVN